jgi:hypothetical protein
MASVVESDSRIFGAPAFPGKAAEEGLFYAVWPSHRDADLDLRFCTKDATLAEVFRSSGNESFQRKDFARAMSQLNRCILVAPRRRDDADGEKDNPLSLAYINRSVVFLQTKHYGPALLDIERAELAGYPENLKHRLLSRKGLALTNVGR